MQHIKDRLKGMGLADSTIKTYTSILIQFFEHTKKTINFTEVKEFNKDLTGLSADKPQIEANASTSLNPDLSRNFQQS